MGKDLMRTAVEPEFSDEFERLFADGVFGSHGKCLADELTRRPIDFWKLFDHGMDALAKLRERPDLPLASYFLALSSLTGIQRTLEDLALDAMVYCESDEDVVTPDTKEGILARYKKCVLIQGIRTQ